MNRYELENAARKVDDYNLRINPCAKPEAEFDKARAECLHHLRTQLIHVESLTFEQYAAQLRIKQDDQIERIKHEN
jgi:hypothetical protein